MYSSRKKERKEESDKTDYCKLRFINRPFKAKGFTNLDIDLYGRSKIQNFTTG